MTDGNVENGSPQAPGVREEPAADSSVTIVQSAEAEKSVGEDRPARRKETERRRAKGSGGLQLEKTGYWTVRAIVNGKRISKSTGTKDRKEAEAFAKRFLAPYVKDDAERTYMNIQAAVATERQIAEMQEDLNPQLKLADMWQAYLVSPMRRDLATTTLLTKEQVVAQFVGWMAKVNRHATEMRHVTRDQVEEYLNFMRGELSASTYNNRLCVLREVFRVLQKKARCRENPFEGFQLRADDSHSRREFTVEEIARIVEQASRKGFEWRALFGIALYTGLRLGDCAKLLWSEVDIVRSIIQKVPEKTKKYRKGRPVTVPIHKVLAEILMQTPVEERSGYVLPTIGPLAASGHGGMMKIHYRIGRIFKNAGIVSSIKIEGRKHKTPDASFHSFRHTFVSLSANAGVPLHIVQSIVGHESTSMTRHYYHENVEALQRAVEAIPSIGETGEVSAGGVAPPDASRMYNRVAYAAGDAPIRIAARPGSPENPIPAQSASPIPQVAMAAETVRTAVGDAIPVEAEIVGVQEPEKPAPDGIVRADPGAEAPLAGRSAERNAVRRMDKLAVVEAANRDAKALGGWGLEGGGEVAALPNLNRKQRGEWVGKCCRAWAASHHQSLLDGTTELIGNGGYRFLQNLWDKGVPMLPDDAVEAVRTFLAAKGK